MDTDALYNTFTNPKVITSMLVLGIVLGIVLSLLVRSWSGQWYMPVAFVVVCLATAFAYGYWLDRQDFRDD